MIYLVLICGSRAWTNATKIEKKISKLRKDYSSKLMILEGDAEGADRIAGMIADREGIAHAKVPANWRVLGKRAGPIRNSWMLDLEPDLVVAFHPDIRNGLGTKDCVLKARLRQIEVEVIVMKQHLSTTHEERYFHVRVDEGGWDSPTYGVRKTVFARKEKDGTWYGAVARCNPADPFSRKVGRTVARRRYFQHWREVPPAELANCIREFPCADPDKGPTLEDAVRFASPKSNMVDNNMDEIFEVEPAPPSISDYILGRREGRID